MRGQRDRQGGMFYVIDLESRVRADHPLRAIKKMVDAELARMGHLFNRAYSDTGRPGVPPERLLKALLLQALYAIRSEAQLLERIDTDLLFRWFLDMDPAMDAFDPTAFSHNRPRLEAFGIIQRFFGGVGRRALGEGATHDHPFTADGARTPPPRTATPRRTSRPSGGPPPPTAASPTPKRGCTARGTGSRRCCATRPNPSPR